MTTKNPNLLVAETFVSALVSAGVRQVCIAPGSRSTPLALAFAAHPDMQIYLHLDERSAAFFALGMGLALGRPAAVVCTSGSAAANFFPAIIEARSARVPLMLLTADRPHELRESGANQTIDQVKLYGDQVLWSVDLPVPEAGMSDLTIRHIRTLAVRAVEKTNGLEKGPVHLNFPFRKPLEPTLAQDVPALEASGMPFARLERGLMVLKDNQLDELVALITAEPHGLIVCGPRGGNQACGQAVVDLSRKCGYPLLADPLSGMRFGAGDVIGGFDGFLAAGRRFDPEPRVILRFGGVPTSASLAAYLSAIQPVQRVIIAEHGQWMDDDHRTTWMLQADAEQVCRALVQRLGQSQEYAWKENAFRLEMGYWKALECALDELQGDIGGWFDGAALREVLNALPEEARVFVGNSLPVRNLDQFGRPGGAKIEVFGNRGASGIDGNISTALGIATANRDRPLIMLVGDITLYHDLNGLYALRSLNLENVTIVVFNNNGGGIFQNLPVRRFDPPFTELFLTPHGLDFRCAADMYGLDYIRTTCMADLRTALQREWMGKSRMIEVRTDVGDDFIRREDVMKKIKQELNKPD